MADAVIVTLEALSGHIGGEGDRRIRCMVEGEAVLNAGHLLCCGISGHTASALTIQALCVQTSHPKQKPHELRCVINQDGNIQALCSCKAGASQRCKHSVAMLLFINRVGTSNLENLSSTDLKQAWGQLRSTRLYEPKMLHELCHVHAIPEVQMDDSVLDEIRSDLLSCAPDSALARHMKSRCTSQDNGGRSPDNDSRPLSTADVNFFTSISQSDCIRQYEEINFRDVAFRDVGQFQIRKVSWETLPTQEQKFYEEHVAVTAEQAAVICRDTLSQDNSLWQRERKLRITASRCRAYFTFIPKENRSWAEKVCLMYSENFRGNKATRHGKQSEEPALKEYTRLTGSSVRRFGLVVNPLVPWLGCSPDGVVEANGVPSVLIEIKSPEEGEITAAKDLIAAKKVKYVLKEGENYHLRKKHPHYSQCQLGMFLLDLKAAHLMLYCKKGSEIIPVSRDENHIEELVRKLQFVYFQHILCRLAQ